MDDRQATDVFISYASPDEKVATIIRDDLEADGFTCWMASRDILASTDYIRVIPPAIEASKLFLLVLSAASIASPQVFREVRTAADAKLPILPVRIEPVTLEEPLKFTLAGIQWVDATRRIGPALSRVRNEARLLLAKRGIQITRVGPSPFALVIASAVTWLTVLILAGLSARLIHAYWFNLVPVSQFPLAVVGHVLPLGLLLAIPVLALTLQFFAHRDLRKVLTLDALMAVGHGRTPLVRAAAAALIGAGAIWAIQRIPPTVAVTLEAGALAHRPADLIRVHECDRQGFVESEPMIVRIRVGAYQSGTASVRLDARYRDPDSLEFCDVWADPRFGLKERDLQPKRDDRLPDQRSQFFEIGSEADGVARTSIVLFTLSHPRSATLHGPASVTALVGLDAYPRQASTRAISEADWK